MEAYRFVEPREQAYLTPSVLKPAAEKFLDGKSVNGLEYFPAGRAATASYYDEENYTLHNYALMKAKAQPNEKYGVYFPVTASDAIEGFVNHRPGTYYNADYYHYDQYTLEELPATGVYAGSFKDAALADKIARMNYDIHVGAVLGLTGKIIAFLGSLICASLPVTGFMVWRGRKKKKAQPKTVKPLPNLAGDRPAFG